MFYKLNFDKKFNYEYIYPTTHDAILHICHRTNATSAVKSSPIYQKRLTPSQRQSRVISQHIVEESAQELTNDVNRSQVKFTEVLSSGEIDYIDEIRANNA
jgi:mevalonate pyrophosphate decarboxylase